jgi:hypothetical protein
MSPTVMSLIVPAHSRVKRDVNLDLGSHVSAAAELTSDQPVVAERLVHHHTDVAVDSGAAEASRAWYFANGNTSHGYREYIAVQNPASQTVEAAFNFMPAHGRPFTLFKKLGPQSRLTVKVNTYVPNDSVATEVTAPRPIVANRTDYIQHGMSSKTGTTTTGRAWYFAAGPNGADAVNWIAVLNPGSTPVDVEETAYGVDGVQLGSAEQRVPAFAHTSLLVNRMAGQADVSMVVTASGPVVAEQATYVGPHHDAMTDTYGVPDPGTQQVFAVMGGRTSLGEKDILDVFNPAGDQVPMLVQITGSDGATTQQSYVVPPHSRISIDAGAAAGDVQFGAILLSAGPLVALNSFATDHGLARDTSVGPSFPGG